MCKFKIILTILIGSVSSIHASGSGALLQEEQSLWIALFGLATIGIFALYLSSDQIKNLDKKHDKILKTQDDIQKKQQEILEFMSGKIEASTKGIMRHREILQENSFEEMSPSFFQEEIEKFQESEALLFDATHELIDFLKKMNSLNPPIKTTQIFIQYYLNILLMSS